METTIEQGTTAYYEMSLCARVAWQAHSASNAGSNGSNRLLPRRQLLADGQETDAWSGNISKHYHAVLLTEYLEAAGSPVCAACASRDGRRAAALEKQNSVRDLTLARIVRNCGVCDAHGFLVTAKNAASDGSTEARQRLSKHSLVEFSFALALPDRQHETTQLFTRLGDSKEEGQMLMKVPVRSGEYALCIRYKCVGVGMDTERWKVAVSDQRERRMRHQAILSALRDSLLSPQGALTSALLPHLTGLRGAIVMRTAVGRAPLYSPLQENFVECLSALAHHTCTVSPFETVEDFQRQMNTLIALSSPALPASYSMSEA